MDLFKSQPRILIVDDEPSNIDLARGLLESDYQVTAAVDGQRALEAVRTARPDLILLDIMMPGMDGYEVCRRLKSDSQFSDIPIIFVTTRETPEDERKGLELGAEDYITKPVSPAILKARVETRLELYENRQKLQQLLSDTLLGSIKVFSEMLALTNIEAAARSRRLRRLIAQLTRHLDIGPAWQYELVATLSQIGCMGIPADVLARLYREEPLEPEEKQYAGLYEEQAYITADMFSAIPNLKDVGEVLRRSYNPDTNSWADQSLEEMGEINRGAMLLAAARHYDREYLKDTPRREIMEQMRQSDLQLPPAVIKALDKVRIPKPEKQEVRIEHLQPGMVLREDVITRDGIRAMPKGFEITESALKHLRRFSGGGFGGLVKVSVFEEAFSKPKANPFDDVTLI